MARRQKDNLTAASFRQAFQNVLRQKIQQLPTPASDQQLIEAFDSLSSHQRQDFWTLVKRELNCETDWPIKHYSNTFLAAKYSQKLKNCPQAKQLIKQAVLEAFNQHHFDQKQVKKRCYELLSAFDIFPIQIDNYIYHLVTDLKNSNDMIQGQPEIPKFQTQEKLQLNLPPVLTQPLDEQKAEAFPSNMMQSIKLLTDTAAQSILPIAFPSPQDSHFFFSSQMGL